MRFSSGDPSDGSEACSRIIDLETQKIELRFILVHPENVIVDLMTLNCFDQYTHLLQTYDDIGDHLINEFCKFLLYKK